MKDGIFTNSLRTDVSSQQYEIQIDLTSWATRNTTSNGEIHFKEFDKINVLCKSHYKINSMSAGSVLIYLFSSINSCLCLT